MTDNEIETRAMQLARADRLYWVKLPNVEAGQNEAYVGSASNAERDIYRQRAVEQLEAEHGFRAPE